VHFFLICDQILMAEAVFNPRVGHVTCDGKKVHWNRIFFGFFSCLQLVIISWMLLIHLSSIDTILNVNKKGDRFQGCVLSTPVSKNIPVNICLNTSSCWEIWATILSLQQMLYVARLQVNTILSSFSDRSAYSFQYSWSHFTLVTDAVYSLL